jgi:aminoglycoside 3-N-acetyltransferase I
MAVAPDAPLPEYLVHRLRPGERAVARALFSLMAEVFHEVASPLSDAYVDQLLGDDRSWVLAASAGEEVVGGLTAHLLPMTRASGTELFIYDLAVRADHQRRGVGRRLLGHLARSSADAGVQLTFVDADAKDSGAVAFYRALGGLASPVTSFTFPSR